MDELSSGENLLVEKLGICSHDAPSDSPHHSLEWLGSAHFNDSTQPINDVAETSEVECFDTDVDDVVGIVNWERLRSDLLRYSQDTPLTETIRAFRSRVCVFAGIIDQDKFVDAITKFRWQSDDKIRSGLSEQR